MIEYFTILKYNPYHDAKGRFTFASKIRGRRNLLLDSLDSYYDEIEPTSEPQYSIDPPLKSRVVAPRKNRNFFDLIPKQHVDSGGLTTDFFPLQGRRLSRTRKGSGNPCHEPAGSGKGGQFCSAGRFGKKPEINWVGADGKMNEGLYQEEKKLVRQWNREIGEAVSLGTLPAAEAEKLGWRGSDSGNPDGYKDLPATLYHVTTARDKVVEEGLKSRDELSQQSGLGLGGGDDTTVSFTDDPKVALEIRNAMRLTHAFLNGRIDVDALLDQATRGVGADKGWIRDIREYGGIHDGSDRDTALMQELRTGIRTKQADIFEDPSLETDKGWKRTGYLPGYEGEGWAATYERKLSPKEMLSNRMEFMKQWLWFREAAGGPTDPLFIFNDTEAFARLDPKQISLLEFEPVPGAKGVQMHSMSEWRTHTGKAVKLKKVIKFDA
jgi:hypothetical protein